MSKLAGGKQCEFGGTLNEAIPSQDYSPCRYCEEIKPIEDFPPYMRTRNSKQCRACAAAYQRKLRRDGYKPSGRNKRLAQLSPEERAIHDKAIDLVVNARGNSKRHGRGAVSIDADYVKALWEQQGGLCALSGLRLGTETGNPHIASLDQINPGEGYTEGNVRLLCWAVNRAIGEMTDSEYIKLCRAVVRCNDYPERE